MVDDHLLTLHLAGRDAWLPDGAHVATTASWWFRLSRALGRSGRGSLSTLIATLPGDDGAVVADLIRQLPEEVTIVHPRETVPQAGVLSARHGLNLLAADALATAIVLAGGLLVAAHDDGPRLRSAAASLKVHYQAIET